MPLGVSLIVNAPNIHGAFGVSLSVSRGVPLSVSRGVSLAASKGRPGPQPSGGARRAGRVGRGVSGGACRAGRVGRGASGGACRAGRVGRGASASGGGRAQARDGWRCYDGRCWLGGRWLAFGGAHEPPIGGGANA